MKVNLRPRSQRLSNEIHFYAPGLKRYQTREFTQRNPHTFVPISVTGAECALKCEHCRGKLLESMKPLRPGDSLYQLGAEMRDHGTEGILLSGGSDSNGYVPLAGFADEMRRIRKELHLKVLVHTGLVNEELARALGKTEVEGALLDVIGATETAKQVCHLSAEIGDYESSLALLAKYNVRAVPHIVLGLHYGRLVGEEAAINMVARYPVAALVLVVLTPLDGTPMAEVIPPDLRELTHLFERARLLLPRTPVILGCARPAGPYKVALDRLAVDVGLNGIAYPAEGIVKYAKAKGLKPRFHETCCALLPLQ